MTSLQSVKTDMKQYRNKRASAGGKLITCYEGEPIPKHRPQDTVVILNPKQAREL